MITYVKVPKLLAHSRGCEDSDVDCGPVNGGPVNTHGYMAGPEACVRGSSKGRQDDSRRPEQ